MVVMFMTRSNVAHADLSFLTLQFPPLGIGIRGICTLPDLSVSTVLSVFSLFRGSQDTPGFNEFVTSDFLVPVKQVSHQWTEEFLACHWAVLGPAHKEHLQYLVVLGPGPTPFFLTFPPSLPLCAGQGEALPMEREVKVCECVCV